MAGGDGRKGLPTATLLGLLALLAGPVTAATEDGLSVENQLYITAGLLGGLALVLTIAVVYLLLTLNRVQSDVFKLKDTISQQKQPKQPPTTKGVVDKMDHDDQPTQMQLEPVSQPPPASIQQSQPMAQTQSQPISQSQQQTAFMPQSQSQTAFMPQSQSQTAFMPQSQPMPQLNNTRNSSYQQQSSYQPATSPGYAAAPPRQQAYEGAPQRPATAVPHVALRQEPSYGDAPVAAYGFPVQAPQRTALPRQQSTLSGDGPYGAQQSSRPAQYYDSRGQSSLNPYVSAGSVYPRDRY